MATRTKKTETNQVEETVTQVGTWVAELYAALARIDAIRVEQSNLRTESADLERRVTQIKDALSNPDTFKAFVDQAEKSK